MLLSGILCCWRYYGHLAETFQDHICYDHLMYQDSEKIFSIYNRKIMKERNQQSFSQEAMNEVNTLTLIDQYQNQHWNWSIDGHEFLSFWHFGKWNLSPTAACDVMKHLQDSAVDRPSILGKGNDLVIPILKIFYCETFWEMNWNKIKPKPFFIWQWYDDIYFSY